MSTLTNRQLVADLGWTMQIIHDSTEGRVPRYWRPPFGDCDNRVRAIAKEVFGLTTVIWNQDSQDWTMAAGRTTLPAIQAAFTGWLNGPRSPGLIVLEHEITADDVTAFINMYPLIAAATGGAPWQALSVAQLFDAQHGGTTGWYQNADDNTSPVTSAEIISGLVTGSASATASASGGGGAHNNGTVTTGTAVATSTPTTVRNAGMRTGVGASGLVFVAALFTLAL